MAKLWHTSLQSKIFLSFSSSSNSVRTFVSIICTCVSFILNINVNLLLYYLFFFVFIINEAIQQPMRQKLLQVPAGTDVKR